MSMVYSIMNNIKIKTRNYYNIFRSDRIYYYTSDTNIPPFMLRTYSGQFERMGVDLVWGVSSLLRDENH